MREEPCAPKEKVPTKSRVGIGRYVAASARLGRTSRAPPVNPLLTLPYPEAPPPDWVEDSGVPQSKVEKGGAGKRAVSVLH